MFQVGCGLSTNGWVDRSAESRGRARPTARWSGVSLDDAMTPAAWKVLRTGHCACCGRTSRTSPEEVSCIAGCALATAHAAAEYLEHHLKKSAV
jgi:hypothetical protein